MRGFNLFSMTSLMLVFALLGLEAPAHARDVAQNDKTSAAMQHFRAGLAEAAHAVALQSKPEPPVSPKEMNTPVGGIAFAAMEAAAQGTGEPVTDAETARQLQCLSEGIYFEARGEPWRGQLAVGRVILNRVASKRYPDTICGVVYQNRHLHNRCQFSFACDGKADKIRNTKVWSRVHGFAAWLLANAPDARGGSSYQVLASLETATHYHADYVLPHWAKHFELTARIGRHIFYTDPSA